MAVDTADEVTSAVLGTTLPVSHFPCAPDSAASLTSFSPVPGYAAAAAAVAAAATAPGSIESTGYMGSHGSLGGVKDMIKADPTLETQLCEALRHIERLSARARHADEERRRCREASRCLRGSVRVMARVRPQLENEEDDGPCLRVLSRTQLEVLMEPRACLTDSLRKSRKSYDPRGSKSASALSDTSRCVPPVELPTETLVRGGLESRTFFFDLLFDPGMGDDDVFGALHDEFAAAVDGEAVCILAYGATGSGKTHTVTNIAMRAAQELERQAQSLEEGGLRLDMRVQIVEIYNEQLRDLLSKDPLANREDSPQANQFREEPGAPKLKLSTSSSSPMLQGASLRTISGDTPDGISKSLQEALRVGQAARATSATAVHGTSSRSHLVMTLFLTTHDSVTGHFLKTGKLSLVDLAGSERIKRSEAVGERLREAQYINRSLSALADVIWAKERQVAHVPYRNSKLTHLLQDALGAQSSCRTTIIVALPPTRSALSETLHSLQFSARLSSLSLQTASRLSLHEQQQQKEEKQQLEKKQAEKLRQENAEIRAQLEDRERQLQDKDRRLQERERQLADRDKQLAEQRRLLLELGPLAPRASSEPPPDGPAGASGGSCGGTSACSTSGCGTAADSSAATTSTSATTSGGAGSISAHAGGSVGGGPGSVSSAGGGSGSVGGGGARPHGGSVGSAQAPAFQRVAGLPASRSVSPRGSVITAVGGQSTNGSATPNCEAPVSPPTTRSPNGSGTAPGVSRRVSRGGRAAQQQQQPPKLRLSRSARGVLPQRQGTAAPAEPQRQVSAASGRRAASSHAGSAQAPIGGASQEPPAVDTSVASSAGSFSGSVSVAGSWKEVSGGRPAAENVSAPGSVGGSAQVGVPTPARAITSGMPQSLRVELPPHSNYSSVQGSPLMQQTRSPEPSRGVRRGSGPGVATPTPSRNSGPSSPCAGGVSALTCSEGGLVCSALQCGADMLDALDAQSSVAGDLRDAREDSPLSCVLATGGLRAVDSPGRRGAPSSPYTLPRTYAACGSNGEVAGTPIWTPLTTPRTGGGGEDSCYRQDLSCDSECVAPGGWPQQSLAASSEQHSSELVTSLGAPGGSASLAAMAGGAGRNEAYSSNGVGPIPSTVGPLPSSVGALPSSCSGPDRSASSSSLRVAANPTLPAATREYVVEVISKERARELTNKGSGNAPLDSPPTTTNPARSAESPALLLSHPEERDGAFFEETCSVAVRSDSSISLSSDEGDIKDRLRQALHIDKRDQAALAASQAAARVSAHAVAHAAHASHVIGVGCSAAGGGGGNCSSTAGSGAASCSGSGVGPGWGGSSTGNSNVIRCGRSDETIGCSDRSTAAGASSPSGASGAPRSSAATVVDMGLFLGPQAEAGAASAAAAAATAALARGGLTSHDGAPLPLSAPSAVRSPCTPAGVSTVGRHHAGGVAPQSLADQLSRTQRLQVLQQQQHQQTSPRTGAVLTKPGGGASPHLQPSADSLSRTQQHQLQQHGSGQQSSPRPANILAASPNGKAHSMYTSGWASHMPSATLHAPTQPQQQRGREAMTATPSGMSAPAVESATGRALAYSCSPRAVHYSTSPPPNSAGSATLPGAGGGSVRYHRIATAGAAASPGAYRPAVLRAGSPPL